MCGLQITCTNQIIWPIRGHRTQNLIFFMFTHLEITTPIRLSFPDILPSKLPSGWFYFSHQREIFFCFSFQINIYPKDVRVLAFSLFQPELKSSLKTTVKKMAKQTKDNNECSQQHSRDIKLFVFLSSFFPFFLLCIFVHYSDTM